MDVKTAVVSRTSIRAYKPDRIERSVLLDIFEAAQRTPSWANSQPWDVFVAEGEALEKIRIGYAENQKNKVTSVTDIGRPPEWPEAAKRRQQGIGPAMARDCGEAASQFGALNQRMFDAPAFIFLCLDKLYTHWGLYDLGAYAQNVMLLAQEKGLSTIPAYTSTLYPEVIRRELQIPENLNIAIGIAIGYADGNNNINKLTTDRDPLSDVVRFCD
jgi:Nitroreductase